MFFSDMNAPAHTVPEQETDRFRSPGQRAVLPSAVVSCYRKIADSTIIPPMKNDRVHWIMKSKKNYEEIIAGVVSPELTLVMA